MTILLNNRYLIVQTLGTGDLCSTFLAQDTWVNPHRWCVVKEYGPAPTQVRLRRRVQDQFRRSATTLTELSKRSNQLPTTFSHFGRSGWFYLVREWVDGQSLSEKLQQEGPFSEALVQALLIRLLGLLDYLHSKKIIHGAIQADNIILRIRDSEPMLINFSGFKQAIYSGLPSSKQAVLPLRSNRDRLTTAADLYDLGLTAIHLLTGILPTDLEAMRARRLMWQGYAANISPQLVAVLNKATELQPRNRYPSARDMLRDLWAKNLPAVYPPAYLPDPAPAVKPKSTRSGRLAKNEWLQALVPGSIIGFLIVVAFVFLRR
ncbi:hypothetical protein BST81_24300 [Leptolyngbya sp. 'hensonii']|uniref:serine/threonine protein kinase n=1 Tax=Leptolyngbya sp. 'hensonii' TaxID=1922337 RepID=UPI00094FC783|nr:protein kinase [Leptolyngbya sp. 'hensonii']OLP15842.1 hypothetical protein BST81_24300 [Leptolyngbya sp. 'hensonii']